MNDVMCPWCEADLVLEVVDEQEVRRALSA